MAEATAKACITCHQVQNVDQYYLRRDTGKRKGECIRCSRQRERNRDKASAKPMRYKSSDPNLIRSCTRCDTCGPQGELFDKHTNGYQSLCKQCVAVKTANWMDLNRERKRATDRAYSLIRVRPKNAVTDEQVRERARRRRARKAAVTIGPIDTDQLWTGLCGICGKLLDRDLAWPDPGSPSIDHIIPLAKGGAHSQENLQWACLRCNVSKGDRLLPASE